MINWQSLLTDAGVTVALIGLIGLLAKALIDFHASRPNTEKINTETFEKVTQQLDRLEGKVAKYREDNDKLYEANEALERRVEALEEQLNAKEVTIKQKDISISLLQEQVNKLDTRLNSVLVYLSGLLKELNERGIQYTPPEPGLLDTNPRMKPIRKGDK